MLKNISFIFLLFFVNLSCLADPGPPTIIEPQWLSASKASIKSGKFDQAIKLLQESNQVSSADWNNLMGFSLRQRQPPDFAGSEKHYQTALNIDPKHKGALEYYGMLKLIKNDLSGAEDLLAKLDKVCFFGCEEYYDLKKAIENFKKKN